MRAPSVPGQIEKVTRKVVTKVFRRRNLASRQRFVDLLFTFPLDYFVFLDETAKDRRSDHRRIPHQSLQHRQHTSFRTCIIPHKIHEKPKELEDQHAAPESSGVIEPTGRSWATYAMSSASPADGSVM